MFSLWIQVLMNMVTKPSNYVLNDVSLNAVYRKPFDIIAERASCPTWLPVVDDVRTRIIQNNVYFHLPDLKKIA